MPVSYNRGIRDVISVAAFFIWALKKTNSANRDVPDSLSDNKRLSAQSNSHLIMLWDITRVCHNTIISGGPILETPTRFLQSIPCTAALEANAVQGTAA